ncbi:MAG TPA: BatD family protein [Acidobacteriota bacterium]|nr:BatD family protein [Acidobacteriota bacterium]
MNPDANYFRNIFVKSAFGMLLAQFLMVIPALSADLSVRAFVDKSIVSVGDSFTLSVELSGGDANKAASPQPPDIEAFAAYRGSGSSTNMQFANGQMSQTRTLDFYFQATAVGKFKIGAVTVLLDGVEHRSDPIQIEVVQGRPQRSQPQPSRTDGVTNDDLYVSAEASRYEAFVNEAVIVTYKIYTRVDVSQYGISSLPENSGFWVEDLLNDETRPQPTAEMINGLRYTVATIKKAVLFPTSAGEKTIEPLEIECAVRLKPTRRSVFDDFLSDPFGRTVRYSVKSDPLQIRVLPLPEEGKPADFSGAVGNFTLEGKIDKATVPVNDVASLKLTLRGSGNIRTLPSPELEVSPGLETYDPEVSEDVRVKADGILGSRTYEWVVVPRVQGRQTIKPIRLPYFDPKDREYKVALLDEIVLDVKPGSNLAADAPLTGTPKEQVRFITEDIRFIKLAPGSLKPLSSPVFRNPAFWGIVLFPLIGLSVASLYSRHRSRLEANDAYARSRKAGKVAKKHLAKARSFVSAGGDHQEFYSECERALSGFAADKVDVARAGMMTDDVGRLLETRGVPNDVLEDYLECLRICAMKRFSPAEVGSHESEAFLKRAETAIQQLDEAIST